MRLGDALTKALEQKSRKEVAGATGIHESTLSRFLSDQTGITLKQFQALLDMINLTVTPTDHRDKMIMAIITVSDLLKEEFHRNTMQL